MTASAMPEPGGAQTGGGPEAGRDPRFVRVILGVYPAWWRERYGEEFAALLLDLITGKPRARRARLAVNAIGGGVHARLHLRGSIMPERVRWPVSAAACAFMVFAGTLAALAKMREGSVFTTVAQGHAAVGATVDVLQVSAVLAVLATLAGGLPIGWAVIRQAVTEGRLDLIRPLVLAPAAVGGWLAAAWLIARLYGEPQAGPNPVALTILVLLGLAAAAICAWSAITVIRRADLTPRLLRVEVVPMAILSACMTVATAADLSWGLAIRSASSALFHSDNGLVSTPLAPNWAATAVVLAVVTAVTVAATIRASLQFLPGARA